MYKIITLLTFLFSINFLTAQCVQGDCTNGKGSFVYPSGAKYIGDFQDGEIHGVGICYYTDGSKYSGQWNHRYPEGMGTKTYADGTKRTGLWKKGQPVDKSGQVIELAARGGSAEENGDVQSGCIKGNCESGRGTYIYIDGSKYEGQFRNGKLHGQGTWFYPDGDKYVGNFKENYSHGEGAIYHANGTVTEGTWSEGEYIAQKEAAAVKEGCVKGNCNDGIGTYIYKDGGARYVGKFKDGLAEGTGTCYYANGERYEGQWADGSFNGNGTLFMEDGSTVNGFWKDGTFMGDADEAASTSTAAAAPATYVQDDTELNNMASNTKVWAVLIGVSNYGHMPALKYTDDDAYRIFAHLKSPEGGALGDEQIKILIDEDATNDRIKSTMKSVFSKAGPNDLVMLYFSGHGLNGSFLPIDFDGFNNKLLHDDINAIFDESPAKYKICIADACHSGSILGQKGTVEATLNKYYRTLAQASPGTALLMSSKSSETSLESSGLRQGVFSHFLIRGLRGEADGDTDGVVTVQELYSYIYDNVRSYTGMRQSPVILGDYDDNMTISVVRE